MILDLAQLPVPTGNAGYLYVVGLILVVYLDLRRQFGPIRNELRTNGGLPKEAQGRPHGTTKEETIIGVVETKAGNKIQKENGEKIDQLTGRFDSFAASIGTFGDRLTKLEDWVQREIEHRAAGDLGKSKLLEEVHKALANEPKVPDAPDTRTPPEPKP